MPVQAEQLQAGDPLGGRMHVGWDAGAAAAPHGQLVFFAEFLAELLAEFLAATGVFERWVSACPLAHKSGNAPTKRDVLGTLMLGLLAGHRRYAHSTALRGDAVAAQALGMNKLGVNPTHAQAAGRQGRADRIIPHRPSAGSLAFVDVCTGRRIRTALRQSHCRTWLQVE